MKKLYIVLLLLAGSIGLSAQTLVSGEYFFDSDPGTGNGQAFSFTPDDSVNVSLSVPVSGLDEGLHNLFIRVKNDLGIWSHFEGRIFYIVESPYLTPTPVPEQAALVAGEWFVDSDPGMGNGTSFILTEGDSVSMALSLDLTGVAPGFHNLFIRVVDANGRWSLYEGRCFYIVEPVSNDFEIQPLLTAGEWFIDTDPGIGNGTAFSFNPADSVNMVIAPNIGNLDPGVHYLFIRVKDEDNRWSLYEGREFQVCDNILANPVITGPAEFCAGSDITLSGSTVANAESYLWTGPNNFTQTGQELSISNASPAMAGVYTLYAIRSGGTGCDTGSASVSISILPTFTGDNPQTICDGDSYSINGNTYTDAGTYTDTLQAANGCDSIVTTVLTVNPTYAVNNPHTICEGESYTINGNTYTNAGTYTDVFQTVNGCDSTITTVLTVNPAYAVNNPQTICDGDSYSINGNTYTDAGTYTDAMQTVNGCDSVVTTVLTVHPTYAVNNPQTICEGESYAINGNTYTDAGTYTDVFQTVNGCDSIVTTVLTVHPTYEVENPQEICEGDSYAINGNTYTDAGTYTDVMQTVNGCDSIVNTVLTVHPVYETDNPQEICEGESYAINGNTYTETGTYTDVFQTVNGCDSTVITGLTVTPVNFDPGITQDGDELVSGEADATYQWVDCDDDFSPISGATEQSFAPSADGHYAVILTRCNISDTTACVEYTTTGISQWSADFRAQLFPNPGKDQVNISVKGAVMQHISISDVNGRVLYDEALNRALHQTVATGHWSTGIYIVKITTDKGMSVQRFVKQE